MHACDTNSGRRRRARAEAELPKAPNLLKLSPRFYFPFIFSNIRPVLSVSVARAFLHGEMRFGRRLVVLEA